MKYIPWMYAVAHSHAAGGPCPGAHCTYPRPLAEYRCHDCWIPSTLCGGCLIEEHSHSPFHRIQQFVSDQRSQSWYFKTISLSDLGFVLFLGHNGEQCPRGAPGNRVITIVHQTGLHKLDIVSCQCPDAPPLYAQLILHGLFPATPTNPETAIAIDALRHFQQLNLVSAVSVSDFLKLVGQMRDPDLTGDLPVRLHLNCGCQLDD